MVFCLPTGLGEPSKMFIFGLEPQNVTVESIFENFPAVSGSFHRIKGRHQGSLTSLEFPRPGEIICP